MKTEKELIEQIRRMARRADPDLLLGIGDDAALIRNVTGYTWAVTTDLLVEDVHFSFQYTDAERLGRKAMVVNLSDLASMGAEPKFVLLAIAMPKSFASGEIDSFLHGVDSVAQPFGVSLIGGDLSFSPDKIVINITALGKCIFGRAIRRDGAKPGDAIFVSGCLGAARAGLELLRGGMRLETAESTEARQLIRAQLEPSAQVALGRLLAEQRLASAMIDISDGLSSDLSHICQESGVGAILDAALIPVAEADPDANLPTLEMALHGGEDYQLLFTVPPERLEALQRMGSQFRLTYVGKIIDEAGAIYLEENGRRRTLPSRGYDHFR